MLGVERYGEFQKAIEMFRPIDGCPMFDGQDPNLGSLVLDMKDRPINAESEAPEKTFASLYRNAYMFGHLGKAVFHCLEKRRCFILWDIA